MFIYSPSWARKAVSHLTWFVMDGVTIHAIQQSSTMLNYKGDVKYIVKSSKRQVITYQNNISCLMFGSAK